MTNQSMGGGRQSRALLSGLFVALLLLALGELLIHLERGHAAEAARRELQAETSVVRARLEADLAASFSIAQAMAAQVMSNPDFGASDMERSARALTGWQPAALRNIVVAPDNVIEQAFPLAPNRALLDVDLEEVPEQSEAVMRLRTDWKPQMAGPLPLVQGGTGLVQRVPVVVADLGGGTRYWGLVAVTLDPVTLYERAGLGGEPGVDHALRGLDGTGDRGPTFFGDEAVFADPAAVKLDVAMPGGRWQLGARFHDGPPADAGRFTLLQALVCLLAVAGGLLVAHASRSRARMAVLASQDALTGLANRHQFLLQAEAFLALAARRNQPFTLLSLDLEDFKFINDQYGHEAGDALLVHVAGRARECLRASDLIARFGGDGFMVLLPDTTQGPELQALVARLRETVGTPLEVGGHLLRASLCVGVAGYPRDGFKLDDLVRVADFSLLADKRARRSVR